MISPDMTGIRPSPEEIEKFAPRQSLYEPIGFLKKSKNISLLPPEKIRISSLQHRLSMPLTWSTSWFSALHDKSRHDRDPTKPGGDREVRATTVTTSQKVFLRNLK